MKHKEPSKKTISTSQSAFRVDNPTVMTMILHHNSRSKIQNSFLAKGGKGHHTKIHEGVTEGVSEKMYMIIKLHFNARQLTEKVEIQKKLLNVSILSCIITCLMSDVRIKTC